MIDQASVDRAVAFLLDVAEGTVSPEEDRIAAAQTVIYAAQADMVDDFCEPPLESHEEELRGMVEVAFREGAKWGREHKRGGFPKRPAIVDLVLEKYGARGVTS